MTMIIIACEKYWPINNSGKTVCVLFHGKYFVFPFQVGVLRVSQYILFNL